MSTFLIDLSRKASYVGVDAHAYTPIHIYMRCAQRYMSEAFLINLSRKASYVGVDSALASQIADFTQTASESESESESYLYNCL